METTGGWSLIEPDSEPPRPAAETVKAADHVPRALLAGIVAAVAGIVLMAIWLTLPSGGVSVDGPGGDLEPRAAAAISSAALRTPAVTAPPSEPATVIVDVEGAVVIGRVVAIVPPGEESLCLVRRVEDRLAL